jgi:Na+/melibiose symporter-like transporter
LASPDRLVGSDERTLFFAAAAGIFNIGWAASHNRHQSLVPELTPVETERVALNAVRYSSFVCSNILVLVSMFILLETNAYGASPATEDSPLLYKTVTGIVLGLGACCAAVFLATVRAAPPTAAKAAALPAAPGTATVAAAAALPGRTPLMWLATADYHKTAACYITMRLATNITTLVSGALRGGGQPHTAFARARSPSPPHTLLTLPPCAQFMALFLTTSLGMTQGAIAAIPFVIFACSLATVSQLTALTQRLGVRRTLCAGAAVFSLGSAAILLLPPAVNGAMYAAAAALGVGLAAMTVSVATLQSSLLGSDTSSAGFVFGSMSALDKLVVGVVVFGLQAASDRPGLSLADFFRYTLGLAPLAAVGVCALLALSITGSTGASGEGGEALHQLRSAGTPNPLNVTQKSAAGEGGGESSSSSSSSSSAEEGASKARVVGSPAANTVV